MEFSDFLKQIGRVVAYYPSLVPIAGSPTATILLCQLVYWETRNKSSDGWIWKVSDEITEETGLTENEQRTARNKLIERGLIEWKHRRSTHESGYTVNSETLNELWARYGTPIKQTAYKKVIKDDVVKEPKVPANEHKRLRNLIETKLKVIPDGYRWDKFIEFVYPRDKANQKFEVFLDWALKNDFHPVYWTPAKLQSLWLQAFQKQKVSVKKVETEEDYILNDDFAPMPTGLGRTQ